MADDREIVVGYRFFNYTSMQLRGCEFITEEEKTLRVGEKVHA